MICCTYRTAEINLWCVYLLSQKSSQRIKNIENTIIYFLAVLPTLNKHIILCVLTGQFNLLLHTAIRDKVWKMCSARFHMDCSRVYTECVLDKNETSALIVATTMVALNASLQKPWGDSNPSISTNLTNLYHYTTSLICPQQYTTNLLNYKIKVNQINKSINISIEYTLYLLNYRLNDYSAKQDIVSPYNRKDMLMFVVS